MRDNAYNFFSLLQGSCKRVLRLEEKKLGRIRICTEEIRQRQKKKETCLKQHTCTRVHSPSDTLQKELLLLTVAAELNPEEDLGAGCQRPLYLPYVIVQLSIRSFVFMQVQLLKVRLCLQYFCSISTIKTTVMPESPTIL